MVFSFRWSSPIGCISVEPSWYTQKKELLLLLLLLVSYSSSKERLSHRRHVFQTATNTIIPKQCNRISIDFLFYIFSYWPRPRWTHLEKKRKRKKGNLYYSIYLFSLFLSCCSYILFYDEGGTGNRLHWLQRNTPTIKAQKHKNTKSYIHMNRIAKISNALRYVFSIFFLC